MRDFKTFKRRNQVNFFIVVVVLILLVGITGAEAATRYAVATGNWNSTATWSATSGGTPGVSFPVAGDYVNIEGSYTVTLTANAACTNLNIAAGSALIVGNNSITVSGTTSVSGTLTHNNSNGTKVYIGLITINSGGNWNNSGNSTIEFRGGITNNGTFTAGSGVQSFTTSAQALTGTISIPSLTVTTITLTNNGSLTVATALAGTGGLTNSATGTLYLGGTSAISTLTATAAGNTVNYNAATAQAVCKVTTYDKLTLSGSGVKTFLTTPTVNSVLSLEGTATIVATTGVVTFGTNATLQYNTSTARAATSEEWLTPFAATGGVIIAGTGTITLNESKVFNTSVPLTVGSGASLSMSTFSLTLNGNLINNGGTVSGTTGGVTIAGTATQSIGAFTTTGAVSMTKTGGTATLTGNISGASLAINGVGGTLNSGTSLSHIISGAITLTGGTLNGGTTSTLSVAGNWTNNGGTFTTGSGTVSLNGTTTQTIGGTASTTYNNLTVSNGSGVTLATGITVNGIFSLTNGIVTTGTNTVTVVNTAPGAVTGGSGTSFINGALIWAMVAGQNYNFMVGKGSVYLPFGFTGITGTSPRVRVEAFSASTGGSASSPLTTLSNTEYWLASVVSGTYSGGSVSLTRQTPLNEFESIGRSATLAGAYTTLNGTVSGMSVINSDNTGTSLGYFAMASTRSITTGTISPSALCPGASFGVPYTKTGNFNTGNVFTAQLSDATGSFAAPVDIGSLTSQNSGTISATIPAGQAVGSAYRIRVVSNNPAVTGSINGADISIAVPTITATFAGSNCGPGPVTLGATASAGTIYWYAALTGGSSLGTGPSFTTPSLSASVTYYVDATFGSCTSAPRTPVLASIINPPTITTGGGGTFCFGSTFTLTSTGTNVTDQYWVGPNSFYSTEQNPVLTNATTAMSGTYTVIGSALSGINLVSNGDFELGNTGFTSVYTLGLPVYNGLWNEGTYDVVADPQSRHPNFVACIDHTSGTGLQMVINGTINANVPIWEQTVNVTPGTDYQYSYWVQSVVAGNPSQLQLYVNGIAAGPVYTALTPTCQWIQFIYNWNSGSSATALLSLENQNIVANGNDFALDDIVFQPICAPISGDYPYQADAPAGLSVNVVVNAEVTSGSIGSTQSICRGATPALLTSVSAGTGSGTITYEWQTNASGSYITISGATSATYAPPALNTTTSYQRRTISVSGGITCYSPYTTPITITVNGPTATTGGPNTVCQSATPSAITLSGASVGGGAATGAWSIISGGGSLSSTAQTANPATVTYTPAANYSGTAVLRLTTNLVGTCVAIADRTVSITAPPTATAGTTVLTCSNAGAVNITPGCAATNYASVTWTSNGTGTFTNANSLTIATYAPSAADIAAGSITLTLTAIGNSPCGNAVSTKTLTITTLPAATISYAGTPFCKSLATAQAVTRTGSAGGTYSALPAGLTIDGATGAITPGTSIAGSYTVAYAIAAAGGCGIVTATTPVTITAIPTASISYPGAPFCSSLVAAQSVTLAGTGAYTGGTFSSAAGLSINASTGAITPGTSTAGTYTVAYTIPASGGCVAVPVTTSVTITTLPVATFSYTGTPYCSNASNPFPTFSGGLAGTFSSTAGLVFVNTSTGQVNLATSTAGAYTVTNTIAASGGCALVSATSPITITTLPAATISYAGTPFCKSLATAQSATRTGSAGGTYSASPAGLTIDGATGAITPGTSIAGSYTVTYTIAAAGGCAIVTATTSVTITAIPTATISYAGTPFCTSVATGQAVALSGTGAYTGGAYSSTAGLTINSSTGSITPSTSTAGSYTVTYTIPSSGGCAAFPVTTSVTITALPVASFSYTGTPYCSNVSNPFPTFSGGVAGTFSSTAGLNFVSTSTGQANLATSTAGTYTVTNTIAASGGCAQATAMSPITITTLPAATISYSGTPFCKNVATAQPVTATGTTGGTYSASPAGLTINSSTGAITPGTSTAGVYTVTYTIAAGGGCGVVTATTSVTITAVPTASISYAGTPFCTSVATGQAVTLSGTGAYTGGTYSATAGLTINSSTGSITPSTSSAGTYTVTYTIPSSGGCTAVPVTTSVTITKLPVATFSYTGTPYCSYASNPFPTFSGGVAGIFSSTVGLVFVSTATGQVNLAASAPGSYSVSNTIAASGGCAQVTATSPITINPIPTATISGTTTLCLNASQPNITFTGAGASAPYTFTYTINGGASQNVTTISGNSVLVPASTSTAGTFVYTLVSVSSATGCSQLQTGSATITIRPDMTIMDDAPSQLCQYNLQSVTANVSGGSGNYSYSWQVVTPGASSLFVPGSTTNNYIWITSYSLSPGTYNYQLTITDIDWGCQKVKNYSVVIQTNLSPNWILHPSQTCVGAAGMNYSVQNLSGTTYTWVVTGGTISSGQGTSQISVNWGFVPGSGDVTVTAVFGSCTQIISQSVTITAIPTATISYAGAPFCTSVATAQPVTRTGTGSYTGGTYTSTAGLTINSSTGSITPSTSTAGTYTVTYTIPSTGGCAAVPVTTSVTITTLPVATFTYTGTPYCSNASNPLPTFSGGVAGTFSSTAGLVFVSTATGQVNLTTSTPGSYTVTNTIAASGGCAQVTATSPITITTLPAATISYAGTPFCKSVATAQPVIATGTTGGTYTASPAGLTINSSTGAITPSTSTAGVYTVTYTIAAGGGCGVVTATTSVTITAVPTATISYSGTPFCTSVATGQAVSLSGTGAYTGGAYSSAAGLTINSSTGSITPSTSTAGTYTVTYTIPSSGGCVAVPVTTSVTITTLPAATFSYTGTPYCSNASNPFPTFSGGVAGTFSSTAGLVFVSTATGQVNLTASTPGSYTVTNTIAASGGCVQVTATSPITITTLPAATISYAGTPFCKSVATAQPVTVTGTTGGTYSASPAGLTINSSTGAITPGTSTAGVYTVTYTIAAGGGCGVVTATTSVTITAVPTATISYTGTPFCTSVATGQAVTLSGTGAYTGGTYTSTAGLTINSSTGSITPSTSTAGTYTVTYTIPSTGGCAAVPVTTSVTITTLPVATFSYTGTPYCSDASNPFPTFSGGVAGTFSSTAGLVFVSTSTGQVNIAASTPGSYTVTNTIAASGGCPLVTATSSITINQSLPMSLSIAPSANPVCTGTSVTFTATPVNGGTTPTYQWKVNGINAGTNSATYAYAPVNNDLVTCVLTSNATCATGNPATSDAVTMVVNSTGNWTGITSTDWHTASNWCGGVPTSATNVTIPPGGNQPVISAAAVCNNITINTGASLTITGSNTLAVGGNWTNNGSFTANSSTVDFNGAGAASIGASNFNNITFSGAGVKTATGALAITGNVTVSNNFTAGAFTHSAGGDWTNGGTFNATASTVNFNGTGAGNIGAGNFNNVVFSGAGTKTAAGILTITGSVNISNNFIAGAFTHAVGGNWTNSGVFTATGSTVNFNGASNTIGASNFNHVIIGGTGTKTETGNIVVNGNFTVISGNFAVNASTTLRDTLTIAGNYEQTGGIFDFNPTGYGAASVLNLAGNLTSTAGTGSITTDGSGATNGQIIFNGTATQTVTLSNSNAVIWTTCAVKSGSYVKLGSNVTLTGDYSAAQYYADLVVSGTIDFGTFVLNDLPNGNQANASHFVLNSGASLITANPDGLSLTGNTGSVQFNGPRTYNAGANYTYNGTSSQTTGAGLTGANNLTIANTGSAGNNIVSLSTATAVSGTLNFSSGMLTTTATNLLSVTNASTNAITGTSAASFINGPIKWSLPANLSSGSTYHFPVGNGTTYLPFDLVNPNTGAGVVSAQVEATASGTGGTYDATLASIGNTEYWSLTTAGNFTNSSAALTRPSAIAPFDVMGGSTAVAGTYTSLSGTPGIYGVTGSDPVGSNRYFVFAGMKQTISTGSISGSPFCPGAAVSVPFSITGTFISGNVFTAQLSDAGGSFSSPSVIGTLAQTIAGTISGTIPPGASAGTGYRIRVVGSGPVITGTPNSSDLTINPGIPPAPGTIAGSVIQCPALTGQIYSIAAVINASTYTWTVPTGWTVTSGSGTNSITVTTGAAGQNGNIRVTAGNSCGTSSERILAVTVRPAPTATIGGTATVCQNSTNPFVTFTNPQTLPVTITYNINGANQSTINVGASTTATLAVPTNIPGVFAYNLVSVIYQTAPACSNPVSGTATVTVTVIPFATVSYAGTPFCTSLATGQAVTLSGTGAYTGGTYSPTAGLTINSSNGSITPSTSTAGTYTVTYTIPSSGGCAAVPVTTSVTITTLPVASFTYSGTPYCSNASNPFPTFSGGVAGTFSSTAGLNFVNTSTGQVNLASSTAGTYTVTNTIAASGGCAQVTATSPITITTLPAATISYSGTPFCQSVATAQPVTATGTTGGTYSASPAGLSINSSTGAITPGSSTAGVYTVNYTIAAGGGCGVVTATTSVTITAVPTATIFYAGTPFCTSLLTGQAVTFSGTGAYTGGTFSSTAGLTINTSTGAITPSTSTAGTYTVTYAIPSSGGCAAVPVTTSVTITALPTAMISYAGTPFCQTVSTPQPVTLTGTTGGIYTASPIGLALNSSTGEITPGASNPGPYTITYTLAPSGGCSEVTATTAITINELPIGTFSYAGSPYCNTSSNPFPTFSGGGVAGTFSSTAGLVFVSTSTGEINIAGSTPGTYTVTNTIAASGGCAQVVSTSPVTISLTPAVPGAITGSIAQCPNQTGQTYSIISVPNATDYNWSVPIGWTITAGAGTPSITVTTGSAGQNGNISVTASNFCGTGAASILAVTVNQVEVTATIGTTDACYPTVKAAFDKINDGTHKGIIEIKIHGNTTETASAVLNASLSGAAIYSTILMYPTGNFSVSGNFASNLIDFNGADNVTIDGRVNLTGSAIGLTFIQAESASTNTRTFRFINSAENNTIRYCDIAGSCISTTAGVIFFSSSTAGNGNDNNVVEFCDITNAGGNRPVSAIFSTGSAGFVNSGNIIRNNNIHDFFRPAATSYGIYLGGNTSDWTILGNSIYETTSFIPTGAYTYRAVYITNTSGNNFDISNNYIGGREPGCSGSPMTISGAANLFYGIELNVGISAPSSIQGNTIRNLSCTSTSTTPWQGIRLTAGDVFVGTEAGNEIGSSTGNGSITVTNSTVGATSYGIYCSSTGTVLISNNIIGSVTTVGSAAIAHNFTGIIKSGTGNLNISNNTIGSTVTSNSVQASSNVTSGTIQSVVGISNSGSGTILVTGNTIANMFNAFSRSSTSGQIVGILSTAGVNIIDNNIVWGLSTPSGSTGTSNLTASIIGIAVTSTLAGQHISGNSIYNLANTCNTSRAVQVYGIYISNGTVAGTHTVSGNFINNLTINNLNTSTSATITGIRSIFVATANVVTTSFYNNIVSLGTGITAGTIIQGIYETGYSSGTSYSSNLFYFNTVYIGGTTSSTTLTYAFFNNLAGGNTTRTIQNNVFNNARSSSSGSNYHFAIRLAAVTGVTINYNDYLANGTGGATGRLNTTVCGTLPTWKAALLSISGDANSLDLNPSFISPGGSLAANYMININLSGIGIPGITTDFGGTLRGNPPSMGAWEKMLRKWKGNLSTDFATAANWTDGTVPLSGENIIFDDDPDRDCYLDIDRTIGNLTINQPIDKMVLNGHLLALNGNLLLTNSGQIDAGSAGSTISFSGVSLQSIPPGAFTNNTVNNFTLVNSSGATLDGDLDVNGVLNLSSGALTLGTGTFGINGTIARTTGTVTAGSTSTVSIGGTGVQLNIPAGSFTANSAGNFTISRPAGAVINSSLSVSGVLNLQAANPSATRGCLETGANAVSMEVSATTIGPGDVNGTVTRSSFVANTSYSFGNQFTTMTFAPGGTLPTGIGVKITLGVVPSWKQDAIQRSYDIIHTGGSTTPVTMNLHYLDSELNEIQEDDLYPWDYHAVPSPVMLEKHARTGQSSTDNWVGTSIADVGYFATAFNEHPWSLARSVYVTFMGTKGWRMITSPTITTSADLLSNFITQGVAGASYPEKQPNFLWFDETDTLTTNMSWRTTPYTNNLAPGRGYYFYVFDSISGSYSDKLPRQMTSSGNAYFPGTFTYSGLTHPVTYTPRVGGQTSQSPNDTVFYDTNIDDQGWNLMGNPTISTLDWDAPQGWTKTNVDNTIYIWDPAANEFKVWNGINGTLGNGLISPFQAFWVKANNPNPGLGFTSEVLSSGGTFYGGTSVKSKPLTEAPPAINLRLSSAGLQSNILVSFKDDGKAGPDTWDAYRLEPLSNSWMEFFTLSSPAHTMPLVINNLPAGDSGCINLPVYVGGQLGGEQLTGTYTMNWELPPDWPADWAISLNDHSLKKAISMRREHSYSFTSGNIKSTPVKSSGVGSGDGIPSLPLSVINPVSAGSQLKSATQVPPFSIVIEKGNTQDNPVYFAPEPALLQNFPNPFSQHTTLRFSLPLPAHVTLKIFSIQGQLIEEVANKDFEAGIHSLQWNRETEKPGFYMLQMDAGEIVKTKKLVITTQ
ncbi:MAG: hypothetical protein NT040_09440 [Bacteroidetes bacterium]|nr:hypothetical protein [Bacteroidota bacterium]